MKYFVIFLILIGFVGVAYAEFPVVEDLTNLAELWCTGNQSEDRLIDFLGIIDYIDPEDHNTFFQEKFAEELLMRTPELMVYGSDGAFFITQKGEDALDCPPVISFEGSFPANDGKRYDFTIWHDSAKTYDYEIKDMVLPAPLKQFKSGIRWYDTQCKDGLELVLKVSSGHPACVNHDSVEPLVKRWWATTNRVSEIINPQTHELLKDDELFQIQYSLNGAILLNIVHDSAANSIHAKLDDSIGGKLMISIPRELIDAKIGDEDDDLFFIIIDGIEFNYGEKTSKDERILTIHFPRDAHDIEIIGTGWT